MGRNLAMEKKKLKIAFVNITQGAVERGAEVFVRELSGRLSKQHKVEVLAGGKRLPERWPVLWRAFLDWQGMAVFWWTLKQLPKILREKYEVVVPINGGWQTALVRLATWVYGGKMVVSGQSGMGWDDRNNLWCFPDRFVALSLEAKRWAMRANPLMRKKIDCVPNGVDLMIFNEEGKVLKKRKGKVVLTVGALTKTKRIGLVIKAVARIPEARLVVVGEGPLKDKVDQEGRELMGDRFELTSVEHKEMPGVYQSADVFVLVPWEREAFGMVFVEAMACGLAVVTIDDKTRRTIVGEAGVLVKRAEKIDELSVAIARALEIDWKDKPRKQASKFDWDRIANEYEKLFDSIVEEK